MGEGVGLTETTDTMDGGDGRGNGRAGEYDDDRAEPGEQDRPEAEE